MTTVLLGVLWAPVRASAASEETEAGPVASGIADSSLSLRSSVVDQHEGADATAGSGQWTERPSLHHARAGLDVATVNGHILAIGGFDPNKPLSDNLFDFVEARLVDGNGTWHDVTPLPTPLSNAQVAALGGFVYVAGGAVVNEDTDAVERFDPRPRSWTQSPKLPERRSQGAAAALSGKLYVAGGLVSVAGSDFEQTASMIVFDPRKRTWMPAASMRAPRTELRMVAAGGHLYAIGGFSAAGTSVSTVERYDPTTDTWTTVAPMNESRGGPGVVASIGGSQRLIVVVGGGHVTDTEGVMLRSSEVFDLDTGRWRTLSVQLPQPRASLVCAVEDDGTVVAIGGFVDVDGGDFASGVFASAAVHALKLQ